MENPTQLYAVVLSPDELKLLGIMVAIATSVFEIGCTPQSPASALEGGIRAAAHALGNLATIEDRVTVANRLSAKIDPLLAEVMS